MNPISAFFDSLWKELLGLDIGYFSTLILLALVGILIFRAVYNWLKRTLKSHVKRTPDEYDDRLYEKFAGISIYYYSVLITWMVATVFASTAEGGYFGNSIFYKLLSLVTLVWTIYEASNYIELFLYWRQVRLVQKKKVSFLDETKVGLWSLVIRVGLWIAAILTAFTLFGIKVETVLGAAGVSALVLALGLRSILEDLFSSLLIYLDRPFRVGDLVSVNSTKGHIKRIGMKTTRIETLSGEETIISNTKLLSSDINNYRRMNIRRVEYTLTIAPDTKAEKLQRLEKEVEKWFDEQKIKLIQNAFTTIKSGSLVIEGIYLLDDTQYDTYIQTQEKVNYFLLEAVNKYKIELK